jgi:hypothetical protein
LRPPTMRKRSTEKDKGATEDIPPRPIFLAVFSLEVQLASELQHARIPRGRGVSELAVAEVGTEVVELSVVESVERFRTEFEVCALVNLERLVQRSVKVQTPRTNHNVLARIPEAVVCAAGPRRHRSGEDRGVEPLCR